MPAVLTEEHRVQSLSSHPPQNNMTVCLISLYRVRAFCDSDDYTLLQVRMLGNDDTGSDQERRWSSPESLRVKVHALPCMGC